MKHKTWRHKRVPKKDGYRHSDYYDGVGALWECLGWADDALAALCSHFDDHPTFDLERMPEVKRWLRQMIRDAFALEKAAFETHSQAKQMLQAIRNEEWFW